MADGEVTDGPVVTEPSTGGPEGETPGSERPAALDGAGQLDGAHHLNGAAVPLRNVPAPRALTGRPGFGGARALRGAPTSAFVKAIRSGTYGDDDATNGSRGVMAGKTSGKSGNGKSGNGKSNGKPKGMDRKVYESELLRLQAELVEMQEWVKTTGQRMVVIFEGRDAAGKGGAIKRVSEYLNPRLTEIVALPAPTERQRTQWYFQRYIQHLPAAGEIKLFDRSWYNRGGVERVMGYCTPDEYIRFLRQCPIFERMLVEDGIILRKYWFSVSADEQYRRFESRLTDPMRRWKLSPTDIESLTKWEDYSRAKDEMFVHTDLPEARWNVVESEDKRAARINMIAHLLASVPYEHVKHPEMTLPDRPASTGYRRTDRELQHEVPDYAASLTDENVPSPYEDPEDFPR